jgi:transketolase
VPVVPELVGGSADLAHSNYSTLWSGRDVQTAEDGGNYVYYGVREFGMSAIANGLALHGGILPYDATFLVFSDYARNAVRMSALMDARGARLHPRFDRPGRRRPDPPADRAPGQRCATSRTTDVWRPVRRGGIGGGVEARDRTPRRPVVLGVLAPEPAAPGAHAEQSRRFAPRRLRAAG